MTASEKAGRPAEPVAEPGREPGTGLSPSATAGDSPESDPLTGSIVAPDDPQQLEQEIERTREQLGQTVQELAARADVKSRARAKAAATAGRVKSTTVQARQNATARAGSVRTRAAAVSAPVWQATPEPVRRTVTKGASRARDQWVPLSAAAGGFIVGYLACRQRGRRQSNA